MPELINAPPDWSQQTTELTCPLCRYNLRGLTNSRCPECGFVFSWSELIQGERTKNDFLFEHQTKRNIWSFWKTYYRTSRPRRFWREINPAQPVRTWRLLIYWAIVSCLPFVVLAIPQTDVGYVWPNAVLGWREFWRGPFASGIRRGYNGFGYRHPAPWTLKFLQNVWTTCEKRSWDRNSFGPGILLILWPMLTLATLMIFRASMRQAKINFLHVLRAVIYGCDFGFLLLIVTIQLPEEDHLDTTLIWIVGICALIATYRIGFAYSRYLRFHRPWATVITSQIIVLMFVTIAWLWSSGFL